MRRVRTVLGVWAALLVFVLGGLWVFGADAPTTQQGKIESLYKEREKFAQDAFLSCTVAYEAGTIDLDQVLRTSNEWTRAKLALCKTKDERIVVLRAHVEREKKIEAKIKALANVFAKGGEADKVARARLNRVNAEIDLERERAEALAER